MELENYCVAEQVYKKLCRYKESIQQLDEAIDFRRGLRQNGLCINVPLGWGSERIDIPDEVVPAVFGIIRGELQRQVKELEQQFKEL